jgi:hypothetical protein
MIRSILAVLAGLVALTIVSFAIEIAADPLLMHLFPRALPNAAALAGNLPARLLMVVYTTFAIGVGGYVTAWIARRSGVTLAAIMGAIEVVFTLYVMIAGPFHEAHPAPQSVWITGLVLMIPVACLGAAVRDRQVHPGNPEFGAHLK